MTWDVEFTDEFEEWWNTLSADEQDSVDVAVDLLEDKGPQLPYPYSSSVETSRQGHMRELRVQHREIRIGSYTHSIRGGSRFS